MLPELPTVEDMRAYTRPSPEVKALRGIAARVRYRPDWEFLIWDHPERPDRIKIQARFDTLEAYEQQRTMRHSCIIAIKRSGLDLADEASFVQAIWFVIENVEAHERREFFQFDGRRIFDPHVEMDAALAAANA